MFGKESMSGAVVGLQDVPAFQNLFVLFRNPLLGVLTGTVLSAVIQSNSASVGILQAVATTGQVSYGVAVPIIMGQNIVTCVTAFISAVGLNKNVKRADVVHLASNVIGTAVFSVFLIVLTVFTPAILNVPASLYTLSIQHTLHSAHAAAFRISRKAGDKINSGSKKMENGTKEATFLRTHLLFR